MIARMTMVTFAAGALANCQEGDTARISVRLTDESGKPVAGYKVRASWYDKIASEATKTAEGWEKEVWTGKFEETDSSGLATFEMRNWTGAVGFNLNQGLEGKGDKYYLTTIPTYKFQRVENNIWIPRNPVVEAVLKRKLKPIPMFARKFGMGMKSNADIPGLGKEFGFDLMVSDWMPPHGQGKTADIFFTLTQQYTDPRNFDAKLKVRFPGVGNGLIRVPRAPREGSVLRLGHNAPENEYQDAFEYRTAALPSHNIIKSDVKEDMNYYMRIRAVTEASGRIASCNYGKIHGDFRFDVTNSRRIYFEYYLNPSPNDRNIEFDTKNNLFKSLSSGEEVNEP